jgi:ATP-dependent helicase/DNAse subunit B
VLANPDETHYAENMPQRRLLVSDSLQVLQQAFVTTLHTFKQVDPLAPVVVLVPHDALALHLRQLVLNAGRGLLGVSFLTWSTFARDVAEWSFLQDGWQPLPLFAARRILRQLLAEEQSENYFAPLVRQPGFARGLLTTLTDLKHAEVRPQEVRRFLEQAHLTGVYRQKIDSLYALYDGYERFLAAHALYDEEDLLTRAVQLLPARRDPTTFFLYGVTDFTSLQRRVIETAIPERDTLVFFPWRAGTAYEYTAPTLGWLTSLGFHQSSLSDPVAKKTNLAYLQRRFFESVSMWPTESPPQLDQSVRILSVPGENREAREIGRMIFDLVRERGLHFADIAVALPDPMTYGPLFRETFAEWGIPCAAMPPRALLHTQAGQAVRLLCQVLVEDFSRARVFEFLSVARPPFTELLGEHAVHAQPARWDTLSLQAGIARGANEWRERLAHLTTTVERNTTTDLDDAAATEPHILQALVLFMERFITNSQLLPAHNSWQGWAEQTLRLFTTYSAPSPLRDQVCDLFARLRQLTMLTESLSLREWSTALTEVLLTTPEVTEPDPQPGVFVSDLATVSGLPFRTVIIPGLIEGHFPHPVRQDPFLLDAERQHLAEALLCDLQQRYRQGEAERLLFTRALHSTTERLLLTYPRLDNANGYAHTPSSYFLRVVEALSGGYATLSDLMDWSETIPLTPLYQGPPQRALDTSEFHLASIEHARARENTTLLGYLPLAIPFFSQAREAMQKRLGDPRLTPFDGMIEHDATLSAVQHRLFPRGMTLSASALEMYARCPFRYFLNTVLGVMPQEDPELLLTLPPRGRGLLVHEILHTFFSRLRKENRVPLATQDPHELTRILETVARAHFATFAVTQVTGLPVVWEVEQERLLEQLGLLLSWEIEHGQDFLPVAFEAPFGINSEETTILPSGVVRLALDDESVIHLHGRIDRIDVSADAQRARILDYKSGKPARGAPVRGRFANGTALQLPLYLYAARGLRSDLQWIGADYVYINRAEQSQQPFFTEDTWAEAETELRTIVTVLVGSLRAGCFPQTPHTCQPCTFPLICSALVETRATRKQEDPRLEALRSLRNIP